MRRFAAGAALLAIALVLVSASTAYAHPTQTSPCKGCHKLTTAVTLVVTPVSSTATTATYSVTVSNPYGTNGWGVFSGNTKVAGAAGAGSTFGVAVGATYAVFGVSGNNNGTEGYATTSISPARPSLPATPSIATTFTTSTGSVAVSWSAVASATSYDYQVGTGSVLSTTTTSITLSGLSVGTTALKVRAVNGATAGGYANSSLVYSAPAPAAPSVSATYTTPVPSTTISWAAVSGATSYDYQVGSSAIATTASTSVPLSGLVLGTTSLKVRARNSAGASSWANAAIIYVPAPPAPPSIAPSFSTLTGSVAVSWSAVTGATGYEYQIAGGSAVSTTATSITVGGLAGGTTAFQVRATNLGGASAWASSSLVRTMPPSSPALDASYPTNTGSVTISWPAVDGATSYDYQVGSGALVNTADTSVVLSGLSLGSTSFQLRATNAAGSSAYVSANIVSSLPAPGAPAIDPTFTTTNGALRVTWSSVSGATGYEYQIGGGPAVATSYTACDLTGLALGTTDFKVRAINNGGPSDFASAQLVYQLPPVTPAKPALAAKYSSNTGTVHVTWTAVPGATSYEYYLSGGSVHTVTTNSIDLSGLVLGTSTLHVRAANSAGKSAYATTLVVNSATGSGMSLKIVVLRTAKGRMLTAGGALYGAVPVGTAYVRVYILNAKTGKYVKHSYNATWSAGGPPSKFYRTVKLPKAGRAYVVISADGMTAKSKVFTIKK